MRVQWFAYILFTIFISCENKAVEEQGNFPSKALLSPSITLISELPDSLKPKVIYLKDRPAPTAKYSSTPKVVKASYRMQIQHYSTDHGLALDAVNCSEIDKDQNIWFGTNGGGVSRYDGVKFINYTTSQGLANNTVYSIAEDRKGNMWFGTNGGGVSCYNGTRFVNYTDKDGLPNNTIYDITEDKNGHMWFCTKGGGVSKFDGKEFKTFNVEDGLSSNAISCIREDRKGNIWIGTDGAGVSCYDGIKFINFNTDSGLVNNTVYCITEDRNQGLWFGTLKGLSRFDGQEFTNYTLKDGMSSDKIHSIVGDRMGNIWCGTEGGGVSMFNGAEFINHTTEQGLSNDNIQSISQDANGNLWFGTYGGGVCRYDGESLRNHTTKHGLSNNYIYGIAEDDDHNLWFGTFAGVNKYDGKSFTRYDESNGLASKYVYSVTKDNDGNLWFGTFEGISKFDGRKFTTYNSEQGLSNNTVYSTYQDSKGNMWFGTYGGGIVKFDGQSFENISTKQGLANDYIYSICEDFYGNLWFGTSGGGVSCYNGTSIVNFTTDQGLANNAVYSITHDQKGHMWFGTNGGGVSKLRLSELKKLHNLDYSDISFETFSVKDGLSDNIVYDVEEDREGNIIIGTNLGFTIIPFASRANDLSKISEELEYYNTPYGFPIKDINLNAIYYDSKGIIWAGTGSDKTALVRFDYSALRKNRQRPIIQIKDIQINEQDVCWHTLNTNESKWTSADSSTALLQESVAYGNLIAQEQRDALSKKFGKIKFDSIANFYPIPQNVILPVKNNHVTFDYGAVELAKHFLVKYQYKLEGYNDDWSPLTNRTSASFGHIHEGVYTFKLKAKGVNGIWSKTLEYSFEVLPPWWKTWWAYILYIIVFFTALRMFSKWRERSLRKDNEKLEKTVEERTKEVVAEKKKSDDLLLNILPAEIAEELKQKGSAEAREFDMVSMLFTDFKDFTQASEHMSAKELVTKINYCYEAFDQIMQKYEIEKIKTIGDSYMAAGGLPVPSNQSVRNTVMAALEMQEFIVKLHQEYESSGQYAFDMRVGIHTGPVVAGIVGVKKFQYDLWGDTVNTASRMESHGKIGRVNISENTYSFVKDDPTFVFEKRDGIEVKGKGTLDMYFVSLA